MPKNWRMLMLFNGRLHDKDLSPNCERPQTNEGKKFPFPECQCEFEESMGISNEEIEESAEDNLQQLAGTSKDSMVSSGIHLHLIINLY